jgi:arsenate reductase-like glutaredoxin family protein
VDRVAAHGLVRGARRLLIKTGQEIVRLDARQAPLTDADADRYLVHEDGFLRVPVLVMGDVLVRGYTDELYREALEAAGRG